MPPFHVKDEMDYVLWVEQCIQRAGAYVEGDLDFELIEIQQDTYSGVAIRKHIACFPDGSRLKFNMYVNADLEQLKYKFDYRDAKSTLIFRKDRHVGHEDLGSLEHIHRGTEGEGEPEKFDHVEIDEVLQEIADYLKDGTLP